MRTKLEFKTENGIIYAREKDKCETSLVGNCYYCQEPIYASAGQAIRHIRPEVTTLNKDEERKEYPVHRRCLKKNIHK